MRSFQWPAVLLMCALAWALGPHEGVAQKPKELQWSHAFDLAARRFGESDFSKDTQKFGVEVFRDQNNNLAVYVSEKGGLAVSALATKAVSAGKGPDWLTGLDLPARKAGQKEFAKDTRVVSLEVFRDPNLDAWLLITEKAELAAGAAKTKTSGGRAPKWSHSFDIACRKGGVKEWKGAAKFGIEAYRDDSTGGLIYVCGESGAIAIAPGAGVAGEAEKAPEWLHGLDLSCRKATEPSFSKDTARFGVEVYRDELAGNLVFISETGSLAAIPARPNLKAPTASVKEPRWSHGLNVKCRAYGEREFSDKTRVVGIEVFRDDNVGATIYVNELGKIAAVAASD